MTLPPTHSLGMYFSSKAMSLYSSQKAQSLTTWSKNQDVETSMVLISAKMKGKTKPCVLVLAGIELIFFTVASMGLHFGFALETVLIIQRCFPYCWAVLTQSQGLSCFSHHPASEEAGGAQEVGKGHSRDSWPQLTKGIFHTIISFHTIPYHHAQQ